MAGYSGTALAKKLGIKAGSTVHAIDAPANYRRLLEPLPESVSFTSRADDSTDLVHLFSTRSAELSKTLVKLRKTLSPNSSVWVSWPKKASKVPTDITEDTIRTLALPLGYVDIKVCAVTEVWSGLKLVVRKALR
jgi:hypothetical protein